MQNSLIIRNARLMDAVHASACRQDVLIRDGLIEAIDDALVVESDLPVIQADGQWLLPGIVDLSVALREPGLSHKATIGSEVAAGLGAGVTSYCFQPEPLVSVDSAETVHWIHNKFKQTASARVFVIGNLTQKLAGERLSNLEALKRSGCVAVTNGLQAMQSLNTQRTAMEYASTHDLTIFIQPIEHALQAQGCIHEGRQSARLGMSGIPSAAESVAIAQSLALIEMTNARVHFCRLSSAEGVDLIENAKKRGLPVTADVAMHQLHLNEDAIADYDPYCHVLPPLRSEDDRQALLAGVANGTIDAICSDHQPHDTDAKLTPFQQTEFGMSTLETLLPLGMDLVAQGKISMNQMLDRLCAQPARIIQKEHLGCIRPGLSADVVLYNPDVNWTFDHDECRSMGKNSPFFGRSFTGKSVQRLSLVGWPTNEISGLKQHRLY